jgi:hypothetical protein
MDAMISVVSPTGYASGSFDAKEGKDQKTERMKQEEWKNLQD